MSDLNPETLRAARCSLSPHVLGLDGLSVGSYYLFEEYETMVSVYLPRLDHMSRLKILSVREAGTIRKLDFRAFFVCTNKTGADYV